MAIDLRILVVNEHGKHSFAHTLLECPVSSDCLRALIHAAKVRSDIQMTTFTSSGYKELRKDGYGNNLTYIHSWEFLEICKHFKHKTWEVKAVLAYIKKLPAGNLLALYLY